MYIGLLNNSIEPSASTGYARIDSDMSKPAAFPLSSGYGMITHIAIFENAEGGEPVEIIELPEVVDVHEGVIPIVYEGKLFRGMDVTAHIVTATQGQSNL